MYKKIVYLMLVFSSVAPMHACNAPKKSSTIRPAISKTDSAVSSGTGLMPNLNKYGETIFFKASGNEPFWGLELTNDSLRFASLSEGYDKFTMPYVDAVPAMDGNVKVYRSLAGYWEMRVQIQQGACIDNMSGKESRYRVYVKLKQETDKDFKTFQGCGNYITDYRLHDIWMLEQMNGQPIDISQFKSRPRLEINSGQNTFLTFTGAHELTGKIFYEKGLLRFTDISTAGQLTAAESAFLENLRSSTGYTVEKMRLVLYNPKGELLSFKKTD